MSELSDLIDGVAPDQRVSTYEALAHGAMRVFGLDGCEVTFLGHNSGAAFRLEPANRDPLLLKVHAPQGDGDPLSPDAIRGGLQWLAAMAELTDVPVQTPLPDLQGDVLPTVSFRGLALHCSVQHWLEGRQVGELTMDQAVGVGRLMGRWHTFSRRHQTMTPDHGVRYDRRFLERALDDLQVLRLAGAVSEASWRTVERATTVACELIDALGASRDVVGVVHGDLGPDNVIVADDGSIRFIDLAQLALAPYLWDLGTALYQYSYQHESVRRAMAVAYFDAHPQPIMPPLALEAFVCAAALSNLAFQCSIPAQRASGLFRTNVERFATGHCRDLVQQRPFALG